MQKQATVLVSATAGVLLLLLILMLVAYAFLNSQHFQRLVSEEIRKRTACDIHFEEMRIHLWRSANLKGIRLTSPRVHPNDFLQADYLHLHYNLLDALFHHRITLEELTLRSPTITLNLSEVAGGGQRQPEEGPSAVEKGGAAASGPVVEELSADAAGNSSSSTTAGERKASAEVASGPSTHWISPPSIDLEKLQIERGTVNLILPDRQKLILRNTDIKAAFYEDPSASCMGSISCPEAELPYRVGLNDLKLDFLWRKTGFEIPRLKARMLDGSLESHFKLDASSREMPFELSLIINNIKLTELFMAFHVNSQGLEGVLQAQATMQGSMLSPVQASGVGQVRILNGHLINVPVLLLLGGYLNRSDEYRDLLLKKLEFDFMVQNRVLNIPHFRALSQNLELLGNGVIKPVEHTQEFQMKLAVSREVAAQLPSSTTEGGSVRQDGFVEIPFRTWGSTSKPKNDLESRFSAIASRGWGGAFFDRVFQSTPPPEKPVTPKKTP